VFFRFLLYIVLVAVVVGGRAEVSRALLLPGEIAVYVGDRPYPNDFDPYYNQPKFTANHGITHQQARSTRARKCLRRQR
jgi:hypothetical protein